MRRALGAWERFWFEPEDTSVVAVVRIGFGLVMVLWTASLAGDLGAFYSEDGIIGGQPDIPIDGVWAPLGWFPGHAAILIAYVGVLVSSVCLVVGLASRAASVIVFVGLVAFTRRNPEIGNSGDGLLRVMAFYVMLMPTGAALSIDGLLRRGRSWWDVPCRAPWGVRLLQVQVSILYLSAVWDKVRSGPLWNDGTALSYVWRLDDVGRFPTPTFATDSVAINLATYGSLAIELALGVLIWNRRLRPWVLALGVALHLGIDYSLRVGFFSCAAIVALASFLPPGWTTGVIARLRRWAEPAPPPARVTGGS